MAEQNRERTLSGWLAYHTSPNVWSKSNTYLSDYQQGRIKKEEHEEAIKKLRDSYELSAEERWAKQPQIKTQEPMAMNLPFNESDSTQLWPSPLAGYPNWMPDYSSFDYETQPPIGFLEMPRISTDEDESQSDSGSSNFKGKAYKESESLSELKKLIEQYANTKDGRTNLAPLLALTDSWTGSKLSQGYEGPEKESVRQEKLITLKDRLASKEMADKQKHDYTNYLMAQMEAKKDAARQQEELKKLLAAQKTESAEQNQFAREQKSLAIKADRNMKQYGMSLDSLVMGVYPDLAQQINQNPMAYDVSKARINAALTSAGYEAEKQGFVPPGGGYAKALQQASEKPKEFRSLIDGQGQ